MKARRVLYLLVFICMVDAMGFGMMIPLIYVYGKQFGLTKQSLGVLTAAFSSLNSSPRPQIIEFKRQ